MKLKLSIKNRWTGSILFEYESENNTIKETLLNAIKNGADLQGADLRGADLRSANLQSADLQSADLQSADLQSANLRGADLRGADLRGADLRSANLQSADLQSADLQSADLRGANLRGANLRGADLQSANLRGADLRGADLQSANLQSAYLQENEKIKTIAVFSGLYTYICIAYITETNKKRIKLGCHDRTLEEWTNDFWNNNSEFPNDNSLKSNMRLLAFETAKKWFEVIEKSK